MRQYEHCAVAVVLVSLLSGCTG